MTERVCIIVNFLNTVGFKRLSVQGTWTLLLRSGRLLLNESSAESFLHYFHAAISNHLSEKPKYILFNVVV